MNVWKISLVLLFAFSLRAQAVRPGGVGDGGGGDTIAQNFVATGYDLLRRLTLEPLPAIDNARLAQAIASTKVYSTEEELIDKEGRVVDALNFPHRAPPLIALHRPVWEKLGAQAHRRSLLVLHEYLGILGIDDTNYQVSLQIDTAGVCTRSAPVRDSIEKILSLSCDRLTPPDLERIRERFDVEAYAPAFLPQDFRGLTKVEKLYLKNPALTSLQPYLFQDLGKVDTLLGLDSNELREIKDFTFAGLRSLEAVYLAENRIEIIEPRAFAGLDSVTTIMVSRNALRAIQPGTFRGLPKLTNIDLRGNQLSSFPIEELGDRSTFQSLNLSDNQLTELPPLRVGRLNFIRYLQLAGNRISHLSRETFRGFSAQKIELERNPLRTIDSDAFRDLGDVDVTVSGGAVQDGRWTNGMWAGSTGWTGDFDACAIAPDKTDDSLSYIEALESGALRGLGSRSQLSLCLDLTKIGALSAASLQGLEKIYFLSLRVKGASALTDEALLALERAAQEFRIIVRAGEKNALARFQRLLPRCLIDDKTSSEEASLTCRAK